MKTKIPFVRLPFRVSKLSLHYIFYNELIWHVFYTDSSKICFECSETGEVLEMQLFNFVELVLLGEIYQCDYEVGEGFPF